MFRPTRLFVSVLFGLCATNFILAQSVSPSPSDIAPIVTASATSERIRIAAPSAVVQLRLEVYDEAGQKLFDTEQRGGNVLDWHLQNSSGERVTEGSYLWVVTVKSLSGRFSQKLGLASVTAQSISLRSAAMSELNVRQAQAVGPIESPDEGLVVNSAEDAQPVTVLAHTGEEAELTRTRGALSFRVGDFFSGTDKEQMRLTEEGNLGIGTAKPKAKLDVAGMIRARAGFLFSDGSTLNINDKGALTLTNSNGNPVPNAAGSGTQDRLAKWTDNAGTLGDSVITESAGNIGIGTSSPGASFEVQQPASPTVPNMYLSQAATPSKSVFQFLKVGANTWSYFGHNVQFNGTANVLLDPAKSGWAFYANGDVTDAFYVYSKPPTGGDNYPLVLKRDGRLKLSSGNFSPPGNNQLEVQVQNPAYAGAVIKAAASQSASLQEWQNSTGAVLSKFDSSGNLSVGTSTSPTGGVATFNGNVGIGTTAPAQKLEVAGNIKVSGNGNGFFFADGSSMTTAGATLGANTFTGNQTVTGNVSATGTLSATGAVSGASANFTGNVTSGSLASDTNTLFVDATNHRVGVGTSTPSVKLDVAGDINTTTQYNIGGNRVLSGTASNTSAGFSAGTTNNGSLNSFFGVQAGANNFFGSQNSFFGNYAGGNNQEGSGNSFFGTSAGNSNTSESGNTFIGASANGAAGITNATAIGSNASVTQSNSLVLGRINGFNGSTSNTKVGIGTPAPAQPLEVVGNVKVSGGGNGFIFADNTTMTTAGATLGANTFTGNQSVTGNVSATGAVSGASASFTGDVNTATQYNIGGFRVLSVAGTNNTFAGVGAGSSNTTGPGNAFFGTNAGGGNTAGNNNAYFGAGAGTNTAGSGNAFFGAAAGFSSGNENNNTFIGNSTNGGEGITNATAIGSNARVTQSNSLVLGSINGVNTATSNTNVGIGTTAPTSVLHIVSQAEQLITASTNWTGGTWVNLANTDTGGRTWNLISTGSGNGEGAGKLLVRDATGGGAVRMTFNTTGNVGIGTTAPTSKLHVVGLPVFANNAAAITGGLTAGAFYRTGGDPDLVCVVH